MDAFVEKLKVFLAGTGKNIVTALVVLFMGLVIIKIVSESVKIPCRKLLWRGRRFLSRCR